jgi:hypothetical protein
MLRSKQLLSLIKTNSEKPKAQTEKGKSIMGLGVANREKSLHSLNINRKRGSC